MKVGRAFGLRVGRPPFFWFGIPAHHVPPLPVLSTYGASRLRAPISVRMDEKLLEQLRENEALLRIRKGQLAQSMRGGSPEAVSELAAIQKLELQQANLRLLLEAQELTRG